ncbi:SAM-dependent methyltransferase [Goodfellowiella coeruleoviolacea]|uniref:S-adenosyl methyltransferase n=1 Tax=Goodfellowiella coeruleoviolacea TaxID=334858 RepID=A0AAE3GEF9_9PSEU|nr:SAM-dependent methyltransferase [Goodfellowiella coeruleoviolacea]MCP2166711.1 S-adenosyl methyltransferase [Goodfellowiella coeruleoviolacea]
MNRPTGRTLKEVDLSRPSAARVYDYLLGGGCNFAVDRSFAREVLDKLPTARELAVLNRTFQKKAVLHCLDAGIRQFLDIGSGIPSVGAVHEVAEQAGADYRVVYADYEPVAVAHGELMLANNDRAAIVQADATDPETLIADAVATGLLDLTEPVAVLMVALLHFVAEDQQPRRLLTRYRDALAPGSYLALSHVTTEGSPSAIKPVLAMYENSTSPVHPRTRAEVAALLDGLDLVEPGLVHVPEWHPEAGDRAIAPADSALFVAVGRVRAQDRPVERSGHD